MNARTFLLARLLVAAACVLPAGGLSGFAAGAAAGAPAAPASGPGERPAAPWAATTSGAVAAAPAWTPQAEARSAFDGSRPAPGAAVSDPAGFLRELIDAGRDEPEYLHPDVAFTVHASAPEPTLAVVRWRIEPGYYLYAKRMEVHLPEGSPPGTSVVGFDLPRGEMEEDPYFGGVEVYRFEAAASVRFAHAGSPPPAITLDIVYQGCADEGLCYPPIRKAIQVRLDGSTSGAGTGVGMAGAPVASGSFAPPPGRGLVLGNGPHRPPTGSG